ncbi:FtsX-like permease family protein [Kitasatospora sp. NPDC058965]|uniref:ABC transporter permease n=1 Tax=Kitasatospora sp. NPDC058965 TaxID=3346682 RepID=UPI0036A8F6A9
MLLAYAWQTLRHRRGAFLGAFLALFCAALTVTACGALMDTGLRGPIAVERYAGTPIVVGADQDVHRTTSTVKKGRTKTKTKAKALSGRVWLPAGLADRLAAVPGVSRVVPELTFPAYPVGADATVSLGHSWDSAPLTPFALTAGQPPRADDEVVLDQQAAARAHLAVGDRVTVRATDAPRSYRVSGIAAPQGVRLDHQQALFFDTAEATRLAGHPGQDTVLGVFPAPGTDPAQLAARLRAAAGQPIAVHTGGDRGPAEFLDAADARIRLVSQGAVMGATALLVAVLVVSGTFALVIQQRARELALLRAVAATPRQLRRLIGREALLIALLAGGPGAVAGLPTADWLYRRFVAAGAMPDTLDLQLGFFPVAAGLAAAVLAGWAAARLAVRRAGRIRPAQALSEAALHTAGRGTGRLVGGLVALAGGVVLTAVLGGLDTEAGAMPVTFCTVLLLTIATALLGPQLARGAAALLTPLLAGSRVSGHLAAARLRTDPRRAAGAFVPVTLLVAMVCTVLFSQSTLGGAAQQQAAAGTTAPWLLAAGAPGVPVQAARAVAAVPGVTAVTQVVRGRVRVDLANYSVQGVDPQGLTRTWDPQVTAGSLDGFGDGDLAVSQVALERLGAHLGGPVHLVLGDGTPVTLTVTAVYARGLGFGDLTVGRELLAPHLDDPLATAVLVATDGRADRAALAAAVKPFPGVAVLDRSQSRQLAAAGERNNAAVNELAMVLVLAFAAIAVANTLAVSTAARGREFALLRLTGTTRRQVLRMLRFEGLGLLAVGLLLGSTIALAVLTAFSSGMTGAAAPQWQWPGYAAVAGLAALLVLAATALPGRLALRGGAR